jgi:type I restriction enzyme M protein
MPGGKRQKTYQVKPQNGNITDVLKELWQAAVNLRGSIEPSDYKRYVLPIIFLRFLSLRFERRRSELQRLIAEPQSEYYADISALEDPDEYRQVGAFVLPAEARWENIRKNAQADDIKVRLDNILELLENTYPELKGLLPRIFAGSNLDTANVSGLINLFSKDIFERNYGAEDLIGRVYEYFIGEFASSEGKRGGEYFTPSSIVRLLVRMLEPESGIVFNPCCGSGGMFVQSDVFTHHSGSLSFYGQESKDFTYRLCRMNLFIHGLDGKIELGNSYIDDKHESLRADFVLANPPFNDGSKGENGWGANQIPNNDPRLKLPSPLGRGVGGSPQYGGEVKLPLSPRNANTMWMLHFLSHLKEGGTAGFVMATGELSNSETARLEVRKALVENNYVDCIVQLSGQLFSNTQIPCTLWFLSKNRHGEKGFRPRLGEILFIDGRKLGALIPGSRKQKELSEADLEKVASVYRQFKRTGMPEAVPGFCRVALHDEIIGHNYALTPGRFVGSSDGDDEDEVFEDKMPRLVRELKNQFDQSAELEKLIRTELMEVGLGE